MCGIQERAGGGRHEHVEVAWKIGTINNKLENLNKNRNSQSYIFLSIIHVFLSNIPHSHTPFL